MQEAFAEFYEAYAVKLALYVSRFLGSELWAEEIVSGYFPEIMVGPANRRRTGISCQLRIPNGSQPTRRIISNAGVTK